jgi:hypothetical protein
MTTTQIEKNQQITAIPLDDNDIKENRFNKDRLISAIFMTVVMGVTLGLTILCPPVALVGAAIAFTALGSATLFGVGCIIDQALKYMAEKKSVDQLVKILSIDQQPAYLCDTNTSTYEVINSQQ